MQSHALARLSDGALLRRLARLVAHDRATTAGLLASIAEVDARKLYAPAGYSSMHAYCVGELRLSEDAAGRRIQAARAARRVPALLAALAEGRLHLTAVCLLASHLTAENGDELIAAAMGRSKGEIETMLVRRYLPATGLQHALAHVEVAGEGTAAGSDEHAPAHVEGDGSRAAEDDEHALAHVGAPRAVATSHSKNLVSLHLAVSRSTREKLRYAQALLSHVVPSGDPAEVLDRALDVLIRELEKRKFGAGGTRARRVVESPGTGSRAGRGTVPGPGQELAPALPRRRSIPAAVRRAVWERDGGRCTFVGVQGHRCESRRFLEFDHVEPIARGGSETVAGLRLRCRTHNQYEAERIFGAGFMSERRKAARRVRSDAKGREPSGSSAKSKAIEWPGADEELQDIRACLRRLGCGSRETRRAVEAALTSGGATFEARLGAALRSLSPRTVRAPS